MNDEDTENVHWIGGSRNLPDRYSPQPFFIPVKKRFLSGILKLLSGKSKHMNENFTSGVLTFADGSTVTVVPQGAAPEPTVTVTDTGITVSHSDGTTSDWVPAPTA